MKLSVVIPLYISDPLHLDFTRQTLASIKTSHNHEIILIVNYCSPSLEPELKKLSSAISTSGVKAAHTPEVEIIPNPKGNILAAAWNLGIKTAFQSSTPEVITPPAGGFTSGEAELAQTLSSHRQERSKSKAMQATPIGARSRTPSDVWESSTPRGVAESPSQYCLILNNDLILHQSAIDNLVTFAEKHPEFLLWTMTEWADMRTLSKATWDGSFSPHPHFSAFMVNWRTVQLIGWFDENLKPAYFEDNDYHIRILVTGKHAAATTTAKFYHFGSRTINVDDSLKPSVKAGYQQNRKYMKKKWGLDPHGKGFDPPEEILKHIRV